MFELKNKSVVLAVREDLGAAISSYEFTDGQPIFRTAPAGSNAPFEMACILLTPWCNRISNGGFNYQGTFYPLAPNMEDSNLPLHGDAFLKAWTCIDKTETSLTLELLSDSVIPFDYRAVVTYTLEGADLLIDFSVTNLSELELPYGLGLHPWFEQDDDTEIEAYVEQVLMNDEDNLPLAKVPVSDEPELDFRKSAVLPVGGLDNCFTGWNQQAVLSWPSRKMSVVVQADDSFSECHIYSKGRQGSFFCFEPVTHPVNAHNWPNDDQASLSHLKQGQSMITRCRFSPRLFK